MFEVSRAVHSSRGMRAQPIVASGGPWGGNAAPTEFARRNRYRCPGAIPISEDVYGTRVDDELPRPNRWPPAPALLN